MFFTIISWCFISFIFWISVLYLKRRNKFNKDFKSLQILSELYYVGLQETLVFKADQKSFDVSPVSTLRAFKNLYYRIKYITGNH